MIWVIGGNGMLGRELCESLKGRFDEVVSTDKEVSILEPAALSSFADGRGVEWIINCSAYTAVDKAEDEVELAYALNEKGVANIANIAKKIGAKLIHISTDYVFNGESSTPLSESAPTDPIGVYGASKLAGEERIREICPNHFIIRTAWLYGRYGGNFVETMLRLMAEKDELGVIADQIGSPTSVTDLVSLVLEVVEKGSESYGTYHYSNEGETSWFEFAMEIQRLAFQYSILSKSIPIKPLTTDQYPTKAKRPAYSLLNKSKVKTVFGLNVPLWQESLQRYLKGKIDA